MMDGSAKTEFLTLCRERRSKAIDADDMEKQRGLADLLFAYDADSYQWPEDVRRKREAQQRPCLVINKQPSYINQVKNSMRANTPMISIKPVDNDADPEIADILGGLIKNIEVQSGADELYDHVGDNICQVGRGFLRVLSRYIDKQSFDQELYIDAVRNPFCVSWDPGSEQPDLQDSQFMFITSTLTKSTFEKEFPGKTYCGVDGATGDNWEDWRDEDDIRIAEYMWKEPGPSETLYEVDRYVDGQIKTVAVLELEGDEKPNRTRTLQHQKIMWAKVSGADILEGPVELPGELYPIAPAWGESVNIEGIRHTWGIIRFLRDPQRAYNYARSTEIERVALEPKAPYLIGVSQVAGLEKEYQRALVENVPFLPYDDTRNPTVPQRQFPQQVSGALQAATMNADQDMRDISGIQKANFGMPSNEQSGKAIKERKQEGEVQTFVYPDNMGRCIRWLGRILVEKVPYYYDNARVVRILDIGGKEKQIPVNSNGGAFPEGYKGPAVANNPEAMLFNDLTIGKYDVVVTLGPSYLSQRQEALDGMLEFMRINPQSAAVLADLVAEAADWPGAIGEEASKRLKKLIPPGIREPEEGEEPPPPPPPDPKMVLAQEKIRVDEQKVMLEAMDNKRRNDRDDFSAQIDAITSLMKAEAAERGSQLQEMQLAAAQIQTAMAEDREAKRLQMEQQQMQAQQQQMQAQQQQAQQMAPSQGGPEQGM